MNETMLKEIRALRENSKVAYVASINAQGYPQVKAMLVMEKDCITTQYYSTNTSSQRVTQFLAQPKASVYFCDEANFMGALFTGTMEVLTDHASKAALWREGCEIYYPKGVDDEDYCVLRFTAETVNYYHGLHNETIPAALLTETK